MRAGYALRYFPNMMCECVPARYIWLKSAGFYPPQLAT